MMNTNKACFKNSMRKLAELSDIERAVKGKIYPTGCTLIPLSAADARLIRYHGEAGEVSNRFAVVNPHAGINGRYLYIAIMWAADNFFHKYQTGINLQLPILLKYFKVQFHNNKDVQDEIANRMFLIDTEIANVEKEIEHEQDMKKFLLNNMFPE